MADQSQQTLAQMVRSKYPGQYDDLDDQDLEAKVLQKYPQYADLPRSASQSPSQGPQEARASLVQSMAQQAQPRVPEPTMQPSAVGAAYGGTKAALDPAIGFTKAAGRTAVGLGAAALAGGGAQNIPAAAAMSQAADSPALQSANDLQRIGGGVETAAEVGLTGNVAGKTAMEAIPSAERAGKAFQELKASAGDIPVALDNAQSGILRLMDWQRKTQLGPTVNKFLNRVTNPKLGQITYDEARDFYKLLGSMSADEASKLAPAVRFDLTKMVVGLKQDVGNAAGAVGQAQKYFDAMTEFRNAKRLEEISDATKNVIIEALKRSLPPMLGGGLALYGAKQYWDATH